MYYIWCEDRSSGFYFWYLINRYILNNKYVVETKISISNLVDEVEKLDIDNLDDKIFICVDNCWDNDSVRRSMLTLDKIIARDENKLQKSSYIAFEQAVVLSQNFLKYFRIQSDHDARLLATLIDHMNEDYTDCYKLKHKLGENGIKSAKTTERIYNKILERSSIKSHANQIINVNGRKKKFDKYIMYHHYITKGAWSECWTTDCVSDCPERFCWKSSAKLDNQYVDCINCNSSIKGHMSCLDGKLTPGKIRKFEEYVPCNRSNIPDKLEDRVRDLFENSILKDDIEFLKKW